MVSTWRFYAFAQEYRPREKVSEYRGQQCLWIILILGDVVECVALALFFILGVNVDIPSNGIEVTLAKDK